MGDGGTAPPFGSSNEVHAETGASLRCVDNGRGVGYSKAKCCGVLLILYLGSITKAG